MTDRFDEHLIPAIRASRHHHLSYFYHALSRHRKHKTFCLRDWPCLLEMGFACDCSGETREWRVSVSTLKEALPEAREAFLRFRSSQARHGNKARKREQRRIDRKAKDLLYRFLPREKKWELRATNAFTVKGGDGRTYQVGDCGTHLLKDGEKRYSLCVMPSDAWIPKHDLMLAHKVLLEAEPEKFLRVACVRDLESKQMYNSGDFLVQNVEPLPNEVCEDAHNLVPLPDEVLDSPREWVQQQVQQLEQLEHGT